MEVIEKLLTESYSYTSYQEFETHRTKMEELGYEPSQCTKDGYSNKEMDDYYGKYTKRL